MASLAKAFSYLIAAQVQAIGLILLALYGGEWLNKNEPIAINWYIITTAVAVLGVVQTFYVVIKAAMAQGKRTDGDSAGKPPAPKG